MNGKNLNVRYRRQSQLYAKRRIKVIIAISAAVLAVLIAVFLIVGNLWRRKIEEGKNHTLENDTPATDVVSTVPSVNGYALSLSGVNAGTNTISAYVNRARGLGGNGLCFAARTSDGKELYSSSLAQSMGKQTASSGNVTLRNVVNGAGSLNLSAGVDVTAFTESDAVKRSVALAYDAAICAELARGGVDDVFIRLSGVTSLSQTNLDELLRFVDTVKGIESTAKIGVALPKGFFSTQGADVIVDTLSESFDFLLYDITGYTSASGSATSYVSANIDPAQLYIMMYKMRVLLPTGEDSVIAEMVSALGTKSIKNWQVYP